MTTPGPHRFWSHCPAGTCPPLAYATQAIADDKTELHRAMCHTAGGCASSVHPGRISQFQPRPQERP